MKKRFLNYILFVLFTLSVACSNYGYVNLNYPREPKEFLPENINTIAVVNRSLTKEEDKKGKIIEGIATGELGSDHLASDECIKGAYDAVKDWGGVELVIPQKVKIYGTGTREMPELLTWSLVADICASEKVDALLVLETFDSNTDLLLSTVANQVSSVIRTGSPQASGPNQIKMNVACYWRLYDPVAKTIVDQYQYNNDQTFYMDGRTPPTNALPETAYNAGYSYIQRFMPSYYTVKRDLYKRTSGSSKNKFIAGYRRAEVANWEGAIEKWNELTNDAKQKTAGRACLNIAVGYEVLGNTEKALEWAQKAYEDYNDKLGRDYAKVLLKRRNIEKR